MGGEAVAVLFANGLGDHILALPALRALQRRFDGNVTLLGAGPPTELLLGDVQFARTVTVPMEADDRGGRLFDGRRAARLLGPTDIFVSLSTWFSCSVRDLLDALRPSRSVGLHHEFAETVPVIGGCHRADVLFDVARHFDPDARLDNFTGPINLPDDCAAVAARVRREVGADRRLLVVHAETSTPEKRWPPERMEEALRLLCAELPDLFVLALSYGPPCFDVEGVGGSAMAAAGVSIGLFLALVATADLWLGVDSFGLHAADLWRVPGVGLFGLTSSKEYGFRFSHHNCHLDGDGDTRRISVEQVVDAVKAIATDEHAGRE
jgi:ADP-heptose:LPS heptosyltransferase